MTPSNQLLTRRELAAYLGLSVSTLNAWAYLGAGPRFFRVGKHTRYRLADVDRWLEEHVREPSGAA